MTLKKERKSWIAILSRDEYFRGAKAGFTHCCNNICAGRKDKLGQNSFDSHVFGSVAEYAFALATSGQWLGEREGHFNRPDVSPNWQVRWSGYPEYGLMQKHTDKKNWCGVLTSGRGNAITIHGWIPFDYVGFDNQKSFKHPPVTLFPFTEWDGVLVPEQKYIYA